MRFKVSCKYVYIHISIFPKDLDTFSNEYSEWF